MKILCKWLTVVFIALITAGALADITEFKEKFITPPDSARPHTWWHWMNGNITKEGITADLEAMARVGIGGAQIFNIGDDGSVNIPAGPIAYLSDEWLELVLYAVTEAKRLGLEIGLHNCAGWSSSGGPWITPDHAMKKVTFSQSDVKGPASIDMRLPVPESVDAYYKEIAVVAFPTPENTTYRIADINRKAGLQPYGSYGIDLDTSEAPSGAIIQSETVLDISGKMAADGQLKWECPAGDWTVMRIGYTITGKKNHPAESGLGLECDKLSRAALDLHWQKGIQPVLDKLGTLAGPVMNNLLIDSYEAGLNTWTQEFEKEFQSRRGYSLTPYWPALAGWVVDGTDVSDRFLWDYRRTISDLFTDNYFGYFADKCHAAGLLCAIEPYDGPFECLAIASKADMFIGEFWLGWEATDPSARIASSAAHVYGRTIVGAEAFTARPEHGRWQNHPRLMKARGDEMWCNGINRFIFHRYAHQPWLDKWPGMTMGQWGTHFERTNTWWNDGQAWMQYIARSQFLLQAGRFHADVLFFGGEFVPNHAVFRPDLKANGYDYDAVGTDMILALSVEDGMVVLPSGMRYALLVMPKTETMSVATARKVQELLEGGATILAAKPNHSPSLTGYPESEREIKVIAEKMWGTGSETMVDRKVGRGRILSGYSEEEALNRMRLGPDFKVLSEDIKINFIHRKIYGADVYFVSNQQDETVTMRCAFRVTGRKPELWNSQKATIAPAMLWRQKDGRTEVTLTLEPEESVFVVFNEAVGPSADNYLTIRREGGSASEEAAGTLKIIQAKYGAFSPSGIGVVDVTEQLNARIRNNRLTVVADNSIAGDPAVGNVKQLSVDYIYDGKNETVQVNENQTLKIPTRPWRPCPWPAQICPDTQRLLVWEDGEYHLAKAGGGKSVVRVGFAPEPVRLDGPWSVRFESMVQAPKPTVFNKLQSLPEHEDLDINVFSGTTVYQKTVNLSSDKLASSDRLVLDLGRVEVMARVLVNGQDLGVLWKNPYRLDITNALRAGDNQLEIQVTNLWVNRLIGDEAYKDDCKWNGRALAEWPPWLIDNQPRPSRRQTFSTWKHWRNGAPLLPSGLIGPVHLRVGRLYPIPQDLD